MGDVAAQTACTALGDDRYRAEVAPDWEIWGPCGGYVAAIALRAAGAASPFNRPASFFCHYLAVAEFAPVDLVVTPLRSGRTVLAQRVEMRQNDTPVMEAMVWSVGDVQGLEHEDVDPPDVEGPDGLPTPPGHDADDLPRYRFWDNFDQRLVDVVEPWPPTAPLAPRWRTWVRYRSAPAVGDPWVDAACALIVLDVGSWPAGSRPHMYRTPPFIAPSLDLYAAFHGPSSEWLLLDAHSPVASEGLLAWNGRVWSDSRTLVASGGGQAVFRHT